MHDIDEWKGAKGWFCLDGCMRDTGPDILCSITIYIISKYSIPCISIRMYIYRCIDFHACMRAPGPVSGSSERSFLPPFW